jgi:SAM-dependent methyltransferase
VLDLSSGYRLYRRDVFANLELTASAFEVQEEIIVKAYARGFSVVEVPFTYFPRGAGRSHAKLASFGWKILRSSLPLWKLRNSDASADYHQRAMYSLMPADRYRHRRRRHLTVLWARGAGRVLDTGCGSSLNVQSLNHAIGMDSDYAKLRYMRRCEIPLVNASALALPFKDDSFDCVIRLHIIDRIGDGESQFSEMRRVLRTGGTLILSTPDHATLGWRTVESINRLLMRDKHQDDDVGHHALKQLQDILARHGMVIEEKAHIAGIEMILRCRKLELEDRAAAEPVTAASTAA